MASGTGTVDAVNFAYEHRDESIALLKKRFITLDEPELAAAFDAVKTMLPRPPITTRAGLATLPLLEATGFYPALDAKAARLARGLSAALAEAGVPGQMNILGSLLTVFFTGAPVPDCAGAKRSDTARFAAFHREMLTHGILLPPSQFEALFVSAAHSDDDIDRTITGARSSLQTVAALK